MAPKNNTKSSKSASSKSKPKTKTTAAQKPVKATKPSPTSTTTSSPSASLLLPLQQLLLSAFRSSLLKSNRLPSNLQPLLQEVKQHLYNRDFARAFGKEEYLVAYAARWSPSRALGYVSVLAGVWPHIRKRETDHGIGRDDDGQTGSLSTKDGNVVLENGSEKSNNMLEGAVQELSITDDEQGRKDHERYNICCIGGGAGAELVAFAGLLHLLSPPTGSAQSSSSPSDTHGDHASLNLTLVDIAPWSSVLESLEHALKNTTAGPLIRPPAALSTQFEQLDVLALSPVQVQATFGNADLVTLMFTLNELYAASVARCTAFLLALTDAVSPGALLLVLDSPGSYSEVKLGGNEKRRYPMGWLLEHALLREAGGSGPEESKGDTGRRMWERLRSEESRWWRLPEGLVYPLQLENMRFQMHLYRRLED